MTTNPLNESLNDVNEDLYNTIRSQSILDLQYRKRIVQHLANAVHDLATSPVTFNRDFDDHFLGIITTQKRLESSDFSQYVASLYARATRGRQRRAKGLK